MDKALTTFVSIMAFYVVLSYVVGPALFYYTGNKTLKAAGNGFIAGSLVSILLWLTYGRTMV